MLATATSALVCQCLEEPSPMGGSLIPKRQVGGKAVLVPAATQLGDGKTFEIIFDGAHICDTQALGPLMGKDGVVRDYTAASYYQELSGATGASYRMFERFSADGIAFR